MGFKMNTLKMKNKTVFESIFRTISYFIVVNWLSKTRITPNQVTTFRIIFLVTGIISFSYFDFISYFYGFLVIFIWDLLDCVDGDLAMYKNMQSKFGAYLEGVFDFSLGRLAGPLSFSICIAFISQSPDEFLYVVLAAGFLVFSDRFFHLSITLKNELSSLSVESRSPDEKLENSYAIGKKIHSIFLYYEFQIASLLFLISSALGLYSMLPLILLTFGGLYFMLGIGVFNFVRRNID